jgi:hypothetical protein
MKNLDKVLTYLNEKQDGRTRLSFLQELFQSFETPESELVEEIVLEYEGYFAEDWNITGFPKSRSEFIEFNLDNFVTPSNNSSIFIKFGSLMKIPRLVKLGRMIREITVKFGKISLSMEDEEFLGNLILKK